MRVILVLQIPGSEEVANYLEGLSSLPHRAPVLPVINVYDLPESLNISIILAVVSQMSPQHQRTGGLHPTVDLLYIVLELPECGELRKLIGKEELEESLAKKRFQQLANQRSHLSTWV